MKWLDLSHNRLKNSPRDVQHLTNLEKIWLSGNVFHCDCEMTWMIRWLNNFTTPSRQYIIVDYQEMKCHSE